MSSEKNLVLKALEQGGSISAAARILNISRSTVREKMKKYDIEFKQLTEGVEV
jgi:transcriptional regulator of acetoin/glycerol metabolism